CLRCSALICGYANFNSPNASTIAAATTSRVYHLLSAGTTYQGACLVEVAAIISSYASMYLSQNWRSLTSEEENFQFFSGLSNLSRNRFFCSFFEIFRKNFRTTVPLRAR